MSKKKSIFLILLISFVMPIFSITAQSKLLEGVDLKTFKDNSHNSNVKRISFGDSTNSICILNDKIVSRKVIERILTGKNQDFQMFVFEKTSFFAASNFEEVENSNKNNQIQWVIYLKTKQYNHGKN